MTTPIFLRTGFAVLFSAVLCLCAPQVHANEPEKTAAAPAVQLAAVAVPVIVDGQIVNYMHLSVKVNLVSALNESKLREREPYFRDALIRAAYKTSFAVPGHPDQLDEPRFKAAMMTVFTQVAGANTIKSIEVISKTPPKRGH